LEAQLAGSDVSTPSIILQLRPYADLSAPAADAVEEQLERLMVYLDEQGQEYSLWRDDDTGYIHCEQGGDDRMLHKFSISHFNSVRNTVV
jgi:hypothetical protein